IAEVDFIEIHAFRAQPKSPNPVADPEGYARELERLRGAYAQAYAGFFKQRCPENGLPARFTVHVVDFPDRAASYEFYGTALYQQAGRPEVGRKTGTKARRRQCVVWPCPAECLATFLLVARDGWGRCAAPAITCDHFIL